MAGRDVEGGLKSVASALDLLDAFADDEELGVSEVAVRLGVAKSTAHRLLTTLSSRGLIEQSATTGRYRLGVHLYELGYLVASRLELRSMSVGIMEELRQLTGWTVHLSIARGGDTLNLERMPTLRGMNTVGEIRRRWPLHAAASGKALCAFDPVAREARLAAGLPPLTARTITTESGFRDALEKVRRTGVAHAHGELMDDLSSLAAPIVDRQGIARAAVSIAGASDEVRAHEDRLSRVVLAAGQRLTHRYQTRSARD